MESDWLKIAATAIAAAFAALAGWMQWLFTNRDRRMDTHDQKLEYLANAVVPRDEIDRRFEQQRKEYRQDLRDIKDCLGRIEEKIDQKADK